MPLRGHDPGREPGHRGTSEEAVHLLTHGPPTSNPMSIHTAPARGHTDCSSWVSLSFELRLPPYNTLLTLIRVLHVTRRQEACLRPSAYLRCMLPASIGRRAPASARPVKPATATARMPYRPRTACGQSRAPSTEASTATAQTAPAANSAAHAATGPTGSTAAGGAASVCEGVLDPLPAWARVDHGLGFLIGSHVTHVLLCSTLRSLSA